MSKTTDSHHAIDTPEGVHMNCEIEQNRHTDGYQVLDFTVTIRVPAGYVIDDIREAGIKDGKVQVTIDSHLAEGAP
jgi:hypothetical protein